MLNICMLITCLLTIEAMNMIEKQYKKELNER